MKKLSGLRSIEHPDELEPLIRCVFGTQAGIADFRVVNQADDYCVLFIGLSHPDIRVVVKLAGPKARMASQFDRTASIHKRVSEITRIPMPQTIAVDVSLEIWPWRYMIRSCLPGTEWAYLRKHLSKPELAKAYCQMGEAIGQIHRIVFTGFGELDSYGQVVNPDHRCVSALIRHASQIIRSPRLLEVFLGCLEHRAVWFEDVVESSLCHEDLHGYNILFSRQVGEWRLAAILDFDKAWAGHTETDLARLELWTGMTSPDFWEAYRQLNHVSADYTHRRPIYQLLWCLEYARTTSKHLADTRRVCQELGIPVIDAFD